MNVTEVRRWHFRQIVELERFYGSKWKQGVAEYFSARGVIGWAAVEDGSVYGYAAAGLLRTGLRIVRVCVAPERCREGLGATLVQAAVDWSVARGVYRILVHEPDLCEHGRALMTSCGFAPAGDLMELHAPGRWKLQNRIKEYLS